MLVNLAHARLVTLLIVSQLSALGCGRMGFDSGPAGECRDADADTLALFQFDGSGPEGLDATGVHRAYAPVTAPPLIRGACGSAPLFSGDGTDPLVIDDHPDWQLSTGTVEFWMRALSLDQQGIVSRDETAIGAPGHFTVFYLDGAVYARFQDMVADKSYVVCSGPVPLDEWHHIAVEFGPPHNRILVDGAPSARTDRISLDNAVANADCGAMVTLGIAGNDKPWVVGASRHRTGRNDDAATVQDPFSGAIDELRISAARTAPE